MRLYLPSYCLIERHRVSGIVSGIVCPVLGPASGVRHCVACVDPSPSIDRGEASVGVSAFLVPLGIDNEAGGGFARPAPAPTKAISIGTGKFGLNVVGLRSAPLTRRMAASHVQLRLPRRRYPLGRESSARTSLGFARHRLCGGWRLRTSNSGSREGDVCWLWESPARTLLGFARRR